MIARIFIFLVVLASSQLNALETLTDPTRPLVNTQASKSNKNKAASNKEKKKYNQLQGIFLRKDGHRAVIDNKVLKVGDAINGYRVHRIFSRKVILLRGTSTKTLLLNPKVKAVNSKG